MDDMYGQQQQGVMARDQYGSGAGPSGSGDIYEAAAAAANGMAAWQQWDNMQGKMMSGPGVPPGQRGMMDPQMMGGYDDGGYGGGGDGWGGMQQQGMPPQWGGSQQGGNQPGGFGMGPNMRR